jgi:O-antigen/teichoic acid export membrane protein
LKKFLIRLLGFNLIFLLLGAILFGTVLKDHYNPVFPIILVFFLIFSLLTHFLHVRYGEKSFQSFARTHMIVTLLRLFVYSAVIILYLIFSGDRVAGFVIFVAVLYILYAIMEATSLSRKSLDQQKG